MTKKTEFRLVAIFLTLFFLSGCATLVRPVDRYPEANEDFAKRLRWLDFPGVAEHMTEAVRKNFLARFGGTDDLRVIECSVGTVEFDDRGRKADAGYTLEYYLLPSASVKKEQIRLAWEYQEKSRFLPGVWRITSEFPHLP